MNEHRIPLGKLAFGIALLAFGILRFTDLLDVIDIRDIWRWWPAVLIFIGLSSEIDSLRARKSDGGYIITAVGVWLLASNLHLFGLRLRSAMPLGIAVLGIGVIVHALIDAPVPPKTEEENGE
jgi:hypothetical protein